MSVPLRSALTLSLVVALATATATSAAIGAASAAPAAGPAVVAEDAPPPPPPANEPAAPMPPAQAVGTGPGSQALFVTIPPCRIIDTRKAGGPLAAGTTRSFVVKGSSGFVPQGGTSGGCGIPAYASAAALSLTTTESTGKGRLVAFPAGGSVPPSTVLSYTSANKVTSNPVVALGSGAVHLSVRDYDYATHLVGDVMGYYMPQTVAAVELDGTLTSASATVTGASRVAAGVFTVNLAFSASGCAASASPNGSGSYIASVAVGGSSVTVYTYNTSSGTPTDIRFTLQVSC